MTDKGQQQMRHHSSFIRQGCIQTLDEKIMWKQQRILQKQDIRQQLYMVISTVSISILHY